MKYFMDSYGLIELSKGNKKFAKYCSNEITTLKVNLAELYYGITKDTKNKDTADYFFSYLSQIMSELPLDIIPKAMLFRYINRKKRFSYTDCLGYMFAKEMNYRFVTGDKQFKGMENVEFVR